VVVANRYRFLVKLTAKLEMLRRDETSPTSIFRNIKDV
jgi:hypothetical protein